MKSVCIFSIFLFLTFGYSQDADQEAVKATIVKFFDGFHKQDSVLMKETVGNKVVMQSIGKTKEGTTVLREEEFSNFMKAIVSIPKERKFQEKLLSFSIQIDGDMANAWTPYEFYLDDQFSHCGVNSFQLFRDGEQWKIIYIIDTRRKEGCQ